MPMVGWICSSGPVLLPWRRRRHGTPHCNPYASEIHTTVFPDPAPNAEHYQFAGTGEIYSYTILSNPPAGFEDQAPLALALIRLDEGPLVTAQLTDLDDTPRIGDRVEMVTRRLYSEGDAGMIVYGYKFRPPLQTR